MLRGVGGGEALPVERGLARALEPDQVMPHTPPTARDDGIDVGADGDFDGSRSLVPQHRQRQR